MRERAHVGVHVDETAGSDGHTGLGGGLPDDGVPRVLTVIDGTTGQRPYPGGTGTDGMPDKKHLTSGVAT